MLVAGLFLPRLVAAASRDVIVYADRTPDGKNVAPPTAEHPTYYYLLSGGYRQEGETVAGESSPPALAVAQLVAKALADRHYLLIGKTSPKPDLLIVFHWGYMNPEKEDFGDVDNPQQVFFNEKEMLALVAGDSLGTIMPDTMEREDLMQAAGDDRYFVVISAFDFAAATRHQKKLLWRARMSIPSNGTMLAEVLPALVSSGAPFFGGDSGVPKHVWVNPQLPGGRVEAGAPTVVGWPGSASAPAGGSAAAKAGK